MTLRRQNVSVLAVLSDTHGRLYADVLSAVQGAERIVHAGDVGKSEIIAALEQVAPVIAVRGNTDTDAWSARLPAQAAFQWAGLSCLVVHNLADLGLDRAAVVARAPGVRVIIYGHSHQPDITWSRGVLFFNPGSAGPRRFHLPRSLGLLRYEDGRVLPEVVQLEE